MGKGDKGGWGYQINIKEREVNKQSQDKGISRGYEVEIVLEEQLAKLFS